MVRLTFLFIVSGVVHPVTQLYMGEDSSTMYIYEMPEGKLPRCPNGTHRDKKTRKCVAPNATSARPVVVPDPTPPPTRGVEVPMFPERRPRCPRGTRFTNDACVPNDQRKIPRASDRPLRNQVKKVPIQEHVPAVTRSAAKQRIRKFMMTAKNRITARYLTHICNSANECLAIGRKEVVKINAHFDDFKTFKYATTPSKISDANSRNGYVVIINMTRAGFSARTLLKIVSEVDEPDNLMYEFTVGVYVNQKLVPRFSLFGETYNIFKIAPGLRRKLINAEKITFADKQADITPFIAADNDSVSAICAYGADLFEATCKDPGSVGLLIQYYDGIPLDTFLYDYTAEATAEALSILIQLYFPLAALTYEFTHYDLHAGNVMIVRTPPGTYITMNYVLNENRYSFNTRVIVKLIDYGRSYFYDRWSTFNTNSFEISETVENAPSCRSTGNYTLGMWFEPPVQDGPQISSTRPNHTIDLICAYDVVSFLQYNDPDLENICSRIDHVSVYSAPLYRESKFDPKTSKINQVIDMRDVLIYMLLDGLNDRLNATNPINSAHKRLGTLTMDVSVWSLSYTRNYSKDMVWTD